MLRFEDLGVWKRSVKLNVDIYKELYQLKDLGFKNQITRSGLSIPSNIAEGFERTSKKESINFVLCGRILRRIKDSDIHWYRHWIYKRNQRQRMAERSQ